MPDEIWIRVLIAYVAVAYLVFWVALVALSFQWTIRILFFIIRYPYASWRELYRLNKKRLNGDRDDE